MLVKYLISTSYVLTAASTAEAPCPIVLYTAAAQWRLPDRGYRLLKNVYGVNGIMQITREVLHKSRITITRITEVARLDLF